MVQFVAVGHVSAHGVAAQSTGHGSEAVHPHLYGQPARHGSVSHAITDGHAAFPQTPHFVASEHPGVHGLA
jgi:hypothetical protein